MALETQNFVIEKKSWESKFFKKNWGVLKYKGDNSEDSLLKLNFNIQDELVTILAKSDTEFDLLEFIVTSSQFYTAPFMEDNGFRLVDSRISFNTLFDSEKIKNQKFELSSQTLTIKDYSAKYLNEILELTERHIINNPQFISRYKNRRFFDENEADSYFKEWINNSLHTKKTLSSILIDEYDKVQGYFIYEKTGVIENISVYKGILTVIEKEYRGQSTHLALQSYLFSKVPEKSFYVDNTTQLTNTAVIRNHIKSQRNLEEISLTFFRKNTR